MSKKNILLAITNGLWLIDVNTALQLGPNVASLLAGEKFWNEKHKSNTDVLIAEPGNSYFSKTFSEAKPGAVAIIPISGPIMKYDNCGDPGTQTYEDLIKQADANPNITGIVLQIDSGGGTVAGTESLSNVIKSVNKPIVTLAEDLMASAAYWIGSSTNYVLAATETTRVGSVGTMISFQDMRPYWEAMGVKFHTAYATASTAKNADIEKALKGDYTDLIKNTLDPLNKVFMESVKANRKEKLNADKTLNGQVYTAADALKYGLIDGIGNLNAAIDKVHELASGASASITQKTTQSNNMKKITLMASHAALIALCGASIESGKESVDVELTDDVLNKINASLADAEKTKDSLVTANDKIKELETAAETSAKAIETLQESEKNLKAKVAVLENPGASSSKAEKDVIESADNDYRTVADDDLAAAKKKIYGE